MCLSCEGSLFDGRNCLECSESRMMLILDFKHTHTHGYGFGGEHIKFFIIEEIQLTYYKSLLLYSLFPSSECT